MKHLVLVLFLFFPLQSLSAQSIQVDPVSDHSSNNLNTFPTQSGVFSATQNQITLQGGGEEITVQTPISYSLSVKGSKVGVIAFDGDLSSTIYDHSGVKLTSQSLEFFDGSDDTIGMHVLENGGVIARDNVANFTFFDAAGDQIFSVSNSSQSPDGEQASGWATDRSGSTIVLYNPEIRRGDESASRATLVFGEEDTFVFYENNSRTISSLNVDPDGRFITLISKAEGTDDAVSVYDRFGNELYSMETEMDLNGVNLSGDGGYLTIFSGSRVQVYDTQTSERLGSSTARSSVVFGTYHPEDEIVMTLNGAEQNGEISDPELVAVHLGQRQISRQDVGHSLSFLNRSQLQIERSGSHSYLLSGVNRPLNISTQF